MHGVVTMLFNIGVLDHNEKTFEDAGGMSGVLEVSEFPKVGVLGLAHRRSRRSVCLGLSQRTGHSRCTQQDTM